MANPQVAYFQIHPTRSKAAFAQLIATWKGLLVSDGYLVYQYWAGLRQSCLAHLIRTARGLTESIEAGMARFGARVHVELQRLCHMGTAANGGTVAGLVGALQAAAAPTRSWGGPRRDVGPACGASRRVAGGVAGRPGRRSDAAYGGARTLLRGLGAQTEPGDLEREGESLGGAGPLLASPLSYPGVSDVSTAGRSGVRAVHRREA
jgi:hypothetical protein